MQIVKYSRLFNFNIFQNHQFTILFDVFRRQKRDVPFIVTSCIREVERRGMNEVGVYRVSGSASDLSRLKKSFETSMLSILN